MRRDYILIAIIIAQAVWGSCERKRYINAQIRANKEQLKEIARNNEKHAKNVIRAVDNANIKETKTTYITKVTNAKKERFMRSRDADSVQSSIANRYR